MLDLVSQKGVHEKPPPLDDSNHLMRPRLIASNLFYILIFMGWLLGSFNKGDSGVWYINSMIRPSNQDLGHVCVTPRKRTKAFPLCRNASLT